MSPVREVTASAPREVAASAPPGGPPRKRWGRRLAAIGALLVVVAAVVVIVLVAGAGDDAPPPARTSAPARPPALPTPSTSALDVPSPGDVAGARRPTATWAPVLRDVRARTRPSRAAPTVTRVAARTPEGTDNVLQVLDRREAGARLWVRVRLAILPNGTTGWVPRSALGGLQFVRTRLVVRVGARTATLERDGTAVLRVPVAVGGPATPTPTGSFYVRNRLADPIDPALGPLAFGTSARVGATFVGIHGTNRPDLVPGATSEGSIALRDADIRRLARLMPVGTPVAIRP